MSPTAYVARHVQALLASLGRLLRFPFASFMTILVIAVAFVIPAALALAVQNLSRATAGFANAIELSVFLKKETALTTANQLAENARARADVAEVTLIPADRGLAEFREYSGFGAALDALKENPLPHVLRIKPREENSSPAAVETLRRYLTAWPEVDLVQLDAQWVQRLNALLRLAATLAWVAAVTLGIGVLAIVGNTIRLEILNRQGEIEVTKLVGGSNAFVRRPFLYIGALYGLCGALLAWMIVLICLHVIAVPVSEVAQLYGSRISLTAPTAAETGALLGAGFVLGWIGAWLSAAKHLRGIEPRA